MSWGPLGISYKFGEKKYSLRDIGERAKMVASASSTISSCF